MDWMRLVVDANVLFAALLKEGATRKIFRAGQLEFYSPSFVLEEFSRHKTALLDKSEASERELFEVFEKLEKIIVFAERDEYDAHVDEALLACEDENDAPYVALAAFLNCGVWSIAIESLRSKKWCPYGQQSN